MPESYCGISVTPGRESRTEFPPDVTGWAARTAPGGVRTPPEDTGRSLRGDLVQVLVVVRGERLGAVAERGHQLAGRRAGLGDQVVGVAEERPVLVELVLVPQLDQAGRAAAHHVQIQVDDVHRVALPAGRRG